MKKIGIDARLYSQTGVGVYIRNLLFYLQKTAVKDHQFYIYLLGQDAEKVRFKDGPFIKRIVKDKWHTVGEQFMFLNEINKDSLNLMHFTYFGYPFLYKKKFIATIHDLTPLFFKIGKASTKNPLVYQIKHQLFKFVLSSQVNNSSFIITPTKAVKKQITQQFGKKYESKTIPIYEGVNNELKNAKENMKLKEFFPNDFVIYVGNFYPHKNVKRLIEAFAKVRTNTSLILIGPDDLFAKKLREFVMQLDQEKRIIFYTNPLIEDFVFFYKNAEALIHPSLSEGFGLPLVEAMYFRCPIIASNIEVFQEILGERYLSFNPYSSSDITQAIESFLKEKPKIKYEDRLRKFSFEKMTEETLKIYEKALNM